MNETNFGPEPQNCFCPNCGLNVTTCIKVESSTKTHIIALILCLAGCWPCVCIPYCVDSCQNRNHFCSSCQAFLGTYKT